MMKTPFNYHLWAAHGCLPRKRLVTRKHSIVTRIRNPHPARCGNGPCLIRGRKWGQTTFPIPCQLHRASSHHEKVACPRFSCSSCIVQLSCTGRSLFLEEFEQILVEDRKSTRLNSSH